jgi:lipopolysaccharide export system protein LptA
MVRLPLQLLVLFVLIPIMDIHGGEVIRADHSETTSTPSGLLRMEWGGVSIVDSVRGISLSSDSAQIWVSSDSARVISRARLTGNVNLQDRTRSIRSRVLDYDPRNEAANFNMEVQVFEPGKSLTASQVSYDRKRDHLKSAGDVTLNYSKKGMTLTADELQYSTKSDSGSAKGNTRLIRYSEGTDSLVAEAGRVSFSGGGDQLEFSSGVIVSQSSIAATADTAIYQDSAGTLELSGRPLIEWKGPEQKDTVEMSGTYLSVVFSNHRPNRISLVGGTRVRMITQSDSPGVMQTITADTSVIDLEGNNLIEMRSRGDVTGHLVSREGTRTNLGGGVARFVFLDGAIDSLLLEDGKVEAHSENESQWSRLSGDHILLTFVRGEIREVTAQGQAKCEHFEEDSEDGEVRLTGDRVELGFEFGKLVLAKADGAVRGSYNGSGRGR